MTNQKQNFETSLAALEIIVRDLETGDLPLEESLKLFEEGVRLSRECQERLTQAERRVEVLLRDANDNPILESLTDQTSTGKTASAPPAPAPKAKRRYVFAADDETAETDDKDDSVF